MEALRVVDTPFDLADINRRLESADALEVIRWAARVFEGRLVMSSSMGAHSAVMLHLLTQVTTEVPVVLIDTGYLFPETYRFAEQLSHTLGFKLVVTQPAMTAARQEALFGRRWEQGEEGVRQYLQMNKVEPMERVLRELGAEAWLAGLRSEQTLHRRGLSRVSIQNGRTKIHPILDWTLEDVNAYLDSNDLPKHPLYDQGYRSIGDVHSTLPTTHDQDPRDGRILGKKKECGIHLSEDEDKSLKSSGL